MEQINKAVFDSVQGAPFARQDLSNIISLLSGPPRPISQFAPQVRAINEIHQWREQDLVPAGSGQESYAEGALANTATLAAGSRMNTTCRTGYTAQVTDEMMAVWQGAGGYILDDAQQARLLQTALDFQKTLAAENCLNGIEYQMAVGDSSNPQGTGGFPGGQTDGLLTSVLKYGSVVYGNGATSGPAVNIAESMLKTLARNIARNYGRNLPDTIACSVGLREDFNGFVGQSANRPITQIVQAGPNGATQLVGGNDVSYYNAGYGAMKIETEPYFSNRRCRTLPNNADVLVMYNKHLVKMANLIPLGTMPIARTDSSVKSMVAATYAQEAREMNCAGALVNIQSGVA